MANTKRQDRPQEIIDHPEFPGRVRMLRWRRVPLSPIIEAQLRPAGEGAWSKPFSLKTDNLLRAASRAAKALGERETRQADALPEPRRRVAAAAAPGEDGTTFRAAAETVVRRLTERRLEAVRRFGAKSGEANKLATRVSAINKHLIPAFGDRPIADLRSKHLNDWARTYKVEGKRGQGMKAPAGNTVNNWNAALQMVFKHAAAEGWTDGDRKVSFTREGFDPPESRPWFAPPEVELLRDKFPAWVAEGGGRIGDGGVSTDVRYLLQVYVALASCTGIRPGEEMELIRESQLVRGAKSWYLTGVVKKKGRGGRHAPRDVPIYPHDHFNVRRMLEELLAWRRDRGCERGGLLFALPQTGACPDFDDPFRRFLNKHDMRTDPETAGQEFPKERVLYSLRHYFATRHLLRGVAWETVADWMGTSVGELKKTYSKIKLRMLADKLTKFDRNTEEMAILLRRQGAEDRQASPIVDLEEEPDVEGDVLLPEDYAEGTVVPEQ